MARKSKAARRYEQMAADFERGGPSPQNPPQHRVVNKPILPKVWCFGCDQNLPRECFSKNALKLCVEDKYCRTCVEARDVVHTNGYWRVPTEHETRPGFSLHGDRIFNDECLTWNFEGGRTLRNPMSAANICIDSPFPRPAKITHSPDPADLATLLFKMRVSQSPHEATGKLQNKHLWLTKEVKHTDLVNKLGQEALGKPMIDRDDEWESTPVRYGDWRNLEETPVKQEHHFPIKTRRMKEEEAKRTAWNSGQSQRKTNFIIGQAYRF